jgi:predicted metalloprotease with PDZ domain
MNHPRPRLCRLAKSIPSDEFGFNLHAEKGRGHFIGTVDHDGIGDKAGLITGQRIVGVNGELVYPNTPHKVDIMYVNKVIIMDVIEDVVALIKLNPMTTTLLVASEEIDKYYRDHSLNYSFDMVDVFNSSASPPPYHVSNNRN